MLVHERSLIAEDIVIEDLGTFVFRTPIQVDVEILDVETEHLVLATSLDRLPTALPVAVAEVPCIEGDRNFLTEVRRHLPQ